MPPVIAPVAALQVIDEFTNSGKLPVVAVTKVK
jgi:hypothetical protein